jgi:ubiquinone/menaquinone biosynthesis C-methylase UbiE
MDLSTRYTSNNIQHINKFSTKAEIYDQYRWNFHPEAIAKLCIITGITNNSIIADLGSGTGMLTAHFVNNVKTIYAIEPNPQMREIAINKLSKYPAFVSIDGLADTTTLADNSVDLIVVGRALHWFNPETTKQEFLRILKPKGWLATFQINNENSELKEVLKTLRKKEYGWNIKEDKINIIEKNDLDSYYFGHQGFEKINYASVIQENWSQFINRICSHSPAPTPDHPLYDKLEQKAKEIFNNYSENGILNIKIATEIKFGPLK